MSGAFNIRPYVDVLNRVDPFVLSGAVTQLVGLLVESKGPAAAVGEFCQVRTCSGRYIRTQVVGFREGRLLSMPLEETDGIQLGDPIIARGRESRIEVSPQLLGRVLDGFGRPMDGGPPIVADAYYDLDRPPPGPMEREAINEPLTTGIRAIDSLLACGKGQRVGIFGGSGVGKSTLLGALARHHYADVAVIALIGERNREVRAFLDEELGPEGLKRSVIIAATSDRPAPLRIRAGLVALAVAEYFRDLGKSVLLVMDSVTRLAMAQREIGLAAGEPPSQKGYPPSVFNLLPRIFERAGNFRNGSITGLFTVLVEGDDFNEPIADAVRAILDGHIVLSRALGAAGHYPAIDVLQSVSRLASKLQTPDQAKAAQQIREAMAALNRSEDLIQLGAYISGSNPKLDRAIQLRPQLESFLRQDTTMKAQHQETFNKMMDLARLT